ncbi:hypothetical protein AVEN_123907-1 [Araneus ventricosus]|uniref:Uncharacterized protein n=1 Tax=Araneus ventricosus TaxID=182803 RepID=A0A4Y2GMM6_ARAVE|nr:hypothetical protein AVEN_123907-1 [Araneus ventricosus]
MGKEQTHLEPFIIACQSPIEGIWNKPWFADLTYQDRRRFTGKNELHSNMFQGELCTPLLLRNSDCFLITNRLRRANNPAHT